MSEIFKAAGLALLACILLATTGCRQTSSSAKINAQAQSPTRAAADLKDDDPPPLIFAIRESDPENSAQIEHYECSYQSGGKTARFGLYLSKGSAFGKPQLTGVSGELVSMPGSDTAAVLPALVKTLQASKIPPSPIRVHEIPFDAVILGENLSRGSDGGYSETPKGNWTAMKVFLPKGGDDGEFFLNLNPAFGEAEITIKDPDYGDYVVGELSKVF